MAEQLIAELVTARPRSAQQWQDLFAGSWPAFIDADPVAASALRAVRGAFAHLQVALTRPAGDGRDEQLAAAAWGVPIAWNAHPEDLPAGYSDALVRSLADHDTTTGGDTLVVCAAQVHPELARTGTAVRLLGHLIDVAATAGLHRVVAPLRLTNKHRYPLTPIDTYVGWRRGDGAAFDPWLRTHERMGARILATTPASQTFVGTVAQWQTWSGLALPASGEYVIAGALAPLHVDLDADTGRLLEPGVWVRHR